MTPVAVSGRGEGSTQLFGVVIWLDECLCVCARVCVCFVSAEVLYVFLAWMSCMVGSFVLACDVC